MKTKKRGPHPGAKRTPKHVVEAMVREFLRSADVSAHGVTRKYGMNRNTINIILRGEAHRDVLAKVTAELDAEEEADTDESLERLIAERYPTMPPNEETYYRRNKRHR